jgi:uncharacterized protein (DUF1330 family)
MYRYLALGLTAVVSAALGAAAVQGLHAQVKPKAYVVTEIRVLDAAGVAAYGPKTVAVQKAAGAHPFNTAGGKVVFFEGTPAPERVAITEWDSLEQAQAWFNSAARKNLVPERDKAETILRSYVVEATQ